MLIVYVLVKKINLQSLQYNFLYSALGNPNSVSNNKRQIFIPQNVIPFILVDITQQAD
jgi:hypothetical protein